MQMFTMSPKYRDVVESTRQLGHGRRMPRGLRSFPPRRHRLTAASPVLRSSFMVWQQWWATSPRREKQSMHYCPSKMIPCPCITRLCFPCGLMASERYVVSRMSTHSAKVTCMHRFSVQQRWTRTATEAAVRRSRHTRQHVAFKEPRQARSPVSATRVGSQSPPVKESGCEAKHTGRDSRSFLRFCQVYIVSSSNHPPHPPQPKTHVSIDER